MSFKKREIEELPLREKINPLWAARKGSIPTWATAEECKANWTRDKWKRAKQKTLSRKRTGK